MTSSGMKRGLAAVAVSALAVTGLPFMATSAHAISMAEQYGADEIVLYTGGNDATDVTGNASVRNDGVNTTVHLSFERRRECRPGSLHNAAGRRR